MFVNINVFHQLLHMGALSTAIQALTDLDLAATVLSIDGIGAFDVVSGQHVPSNCECMVAFVALCIGTGELPAPFSAPELHVRISAVHDEGLWRSFLQVVPARRKESLW